MSKPSDKPHFDVTAGIVWKGGKVLVSKRQEGRHLGGYWEFPGGKREMGENLKACLEREIREELGVVIEAGEALMCIDHEYGAKSITLHVFQCDALSGEPMALEAQEIRWVAPRDLPYMLFPPPDRAIIDYLIRRTGPGEIGEETKPS